MPSNNDEIRIEFDGVTRHYYIVWELSVTSSGETKEEALEDLREAAHFGVDNLIDQKLRDIIEIVSTRPRLVTRGRVELDDKK